MEAREHAAQPIATELEPPGAVAFLRDGGAWVTERASGRTLRFRPPSVPASADDVDVAGSTEVTEVARIADLELLDQRWLATARGFGLGDVADIVFNIPIERYEAPASRLLVKYYAMIVDGFLGPEQFTQIKPSLIREIIVHARAAGWDPGAKGEQILELVENAGLPHRPALLLLPEWPATRAPELAGYEPRIQVLKLA
mgnify:CR=1 FL=1